MKNIPSVFIFVSLLTVPMCVPRTTLGDTPQLKEKMQGLYRSLADLLTDVSSDERFNDPKNATRIEREIKALSGYSHDLNKKDQGSKLSDPTLPIIGDFLVTETAEAYRSFREGRKDYARSILRSVPGYCIECHSRNPVGADFSKLPLEPTAPLKPLDRARFYGATRQFDRSIAEFQRVLKGEVKSQSPYEFEDAIRSALTIAVRFKRNPALANEVIEASTSNLSLPKFLEQDLVRWQASVKEWEHDSKRKTTTEDGLYAEAQRLVAQARKQQSYALDHGADILYLRASSVLYDLLQKNPNGKHTADALLLQGMCYEVLSPRQLETLHYLYYEACIRQAPHTETARTCYRQYERSMFFGYTGSAGTDLPQEIQDKLLELWSIASKTSGKL